MHPRGALCLSRIKSYCVTAKALSSYAQYDGHTKAKPKGVAEIACDIANMEIFRVCWNYVTTQQCPCMNADGAKSGCGL